MACGGASRRHRALSCPSIAGTEYSFFTYDFARNSWDDNTKTMTAKPLKMHMDHSFNVSKFRREDYVDKKLRAKPSVVKWTKDYYLDRYSSVPEMPFEIERLHYNIVCSKTSLAVQPLE